MTKVPREQNSRSKEEKSAVGERKFFHNGNKSAPLVENLIDKILKESPSLREPI